MAFDGAFLYKTLAELREAVGCHIEKIYQPSFQELVLLLRKKGFTKRLLITVKSGNARIQFTENKYENPQTPPMFCMLLRKYLSGAKLVDIIQPDFERVAVLVFSAFSEMNDIIEIKLICEFIGNSSNIILVGENDKIIDALHHSDIEKNDRLLLPGATYVFPKKQNKLNPIKTDISDILSACNLKEPNELLNLLDGFSPLICKEIALANNSSQKLGEVLNSIKGTPTPTIIYKEDNTPLDFSYTNISQYTNYKTEIFETFSDLLDAFYTKKENIAKINNSARDIIKLINNLITRTKKKLNLRINDLEKCKNRDTLRIYGELLKANLYAIPNGSEFAEVENYYDDMKIIKIPLDPALSPSNNANKYFKDYKKTYTAEQTLTKLIVKDKEELVYFDSVLESISRCTTISEIEEIRSELAQGGFLKNKQSKGIKTKPKSTFNEYTSIEGYKIIVGKNNTQNDYLTTNLANKNDLWFHTKNVAGSHVVVFSDGNEVSQETILQAALLAAKNSKASNSSNVAVDYTPIKFVKKPNGAKPGMVIYTTNKTVYVTPSNKEENI